MERGFETVMIRKFYQWNKLFERESPTRFRFYINTRI